MNGGCSSDSGCTNFDWLAPALLFQMLRPREQKLDWPCAMQGGPANESTVAPREPAAQPATPPEKRATRWEAHAAVMHRRRHGGLVTKRPTF